MSDLKPSSVRIPRVIIALSVIKSFSRHITSENGPELYSHDANTEVLVPLNAAASSYRVVMAFVNRRQDT